MPDVIRANAHSADRQVIWSSDKAIVGRRFDDNHELDEAPSGMLVVHGDSVDDSEGERKSEHASLKPQVGYFVEIYFPGAGCLRPDCRRGRALQEAARAVRGDQRRSPGSVAGAVAAGLFLYFTLFWLARRADALIRTQQEQLVQKRNPRRGRRDGLGGGARHPQPAGLDPLRRSSPELSPDAGEPARDIIAEVDRMEHWVRMLLSYARPVASQPVAVEVGELVAHGLAEFESAKPHAGRSPCAVWSPPDLPPVSADPLLLGQVLGSLLANAVEGAARTRRDRGLGRARRTPGGCVCGTAARASRRPARQGVQALFTTKTKGWVSACRSPGASSKRLAGDLSCAASRVAARSAEFRLPAFRQG